eukprot:3595860-Lingulodinium_polyedra.AAC.1
MVCSESTEEAWKDAPLEGPISLLHTLKAMLRSGGDPRRWLAEFCRDRKIEKSDRVYHELVVLTDVLYFGGTFDQ